MTMTRNAAKRLVPLGGALFGLLLAFAASAQRVPAPHDWSHRHLIYSNPDTLEEAMAKGDYNEWARNYRDPRFVLALVRKMERQEIEAAQAFAKARGANNGSNGNRGNGNGNGNNGNGNNGNGNNGNGNNGNGNNGNGNNGNGNGNGGNNAAAPMHRDWSYVMGGAGGVGAPGVFPAKYNFDISAAPSCANDFVVFPTASAGVTGAGNFATITGTVNGNMGPGTVATFTNGARTLTITNNGTNSGLGFAGDTGNNNTNATNLANAINRNGGTVGVRASAAGNVVTVTALTQGAGGNSIAVGGNLNNVVPSGLNMAGGSGTAGQPTIFAVNQLYASCAGSGALGAPSLLWSYNTGNGAIADQSPILSLDGTQVAFIQRTAGVASLVLLKWAAAGAGVYVGAPSAPTAVTNANYRTCTAPCMTTITLSGSPNVTNSSPYYYYDTDEMWVGADNGTLHKFTGIFLGTPAESGAPWPVTVVGGRVLSPPVYDGAHNLVFVGSAREATTSTGGRLHSVNNATGAVITSGLLAGNPAGNVGSQGVAEAPIVDQLANQVYTFVATDTSAACSGVECQAVYQFATSATINGLTAPKVTLGRGDVATKVMYAGVFDNAYYTSTATNPTGALYVCGSEGTNANARRPTLWRITITANAMAATVAGTSLVGADTADASGNGGSCSPITDIQNGANNYIFLSVPSQGNRTGCAGACIYMYNLTGATAANWNARNAVAGLAAAGGTGGIVIDNSSGVVGASQVYYMTLTNPGNAIQASQAGLN